jgi:importin subunit beta-1
LPVNQWPQLIQSLLDNVTSSDNPLLRQASLVSIGFVCETTNPEVLKGQANDILTAVVQGARKEEENQEVRLAAVRALYNSLEFIRENFESEVKMLTYFTFTFYNLHYTNMLPIV